MKYSALQLCVLAACLIDVVHDNLQVEPEALGALALGEAHSKSAGDTQEVKKVCKNVILSQKFI